MDWGRWFRGRLHQITLPKVRSPVALHCIRIVSRTPIDFRAGYENLRVRDGYKKPLLEVLFSIVYLVHASFLAISLSRPQAHWQHPTCPSHPCNSDVDDNRHSDTEKMAIVPIYFLSTQSCHFPSKPPIFSKLSCAQVSNFSSRNFSTIHVNMPL